MEFNENSDVEVKDHHHSRADQAADDYGEENYHPMKELETLNAFYCKIRESRFEMVSDAKAKLETVETGGHHGKIQVRKSIKSFFTPPPKFQKHLKRGVYLACLLIKNEKILVTTEEMIPVIEVDENYPATFQNDFHWLVKVACAWNTVKSLQQDIERSVSCSNLYFRSKLLEAVLQMQAVFEIQDLGPLFYRPLKDKSGTTVLCTINTIQDFRTVNVNSTKWIPIERIERRIGCADENVGEFLFSSISEQMEYLKVRQTILAPGLYLGYLKVKFLLDSVQVLVPAHLPSVLPYCFVRDNPKVTSDELDWLREMKEHSACNANLTTSNHLKQFGHSLHLSAKTLFASLGISEADAYTNRFYIEEIIHFNADVSIILIVPSIENVCAAPGKNDELNSHQDFNFLPIQVFDIVHNVAYHSEFLNVYCRLSLMLEMDKFLAEHLLREAFSLDEVDDSKERLQELQKIHSQADHLWQSTRWMMNVLSWARDKHSTSGILVSHLYQWHIENTPPSNKEIVDANNRKHSFSNCHAEAAGPAKVHTSSSLRMRRSSNDVSRLKNTVLEVVCSENSKSCCETKLELPADVSDKPGVIHVYAAYDAGLTNGTSVKLHVSIKTTAREVIDLVVKQLNVAAKAKGSVKGSVLDNECVDVENFCLVAVLGARERCLRDDFCPLQLQNPWAKGSLYIRRKCELLAAIQQHNCKQLAR